MPSENVADWVGRIRTAFPELDIGSAYEAALASAAGGAARDRMQTLLAFTPWRDDGHALVRAYGRGLVGHDVVMQAGPSGRPSPSDGAPRRPARQVPKIRWLD